MAEVIRWAGVPADVPRALREAADRIEAGDEPALNFVVAVFVEANGSFTTYGWGPYTFLEAMGALARAANGKITDG